MNQTPIIRLTIRVGASLVMELRPTGLRQSSPHVCSKYVVMSHIGLTRAPDAADCAAGTSTRNPRPANINPSENLAGLDGCCDPSFIQSQAKAGAKTMRKKALTD